MALNKTTKNSIPTSVSPDDFNIYFTSIGEELAKKFPHTKPEWELPSSIYRFHFQSVTATMVEKLLKLQSNRTKLAMFDIDSRLLRAAAQLIAPSLCHIFNYSLKTGTIPNEWKIGKVCPIFKGKGANDQTNNYRPITVLPHIAKIMEKLVHEQLMNYISTKSFTSPEQSAFLKRHSTETALHKVVDDRHEAINDKLLVGLCTVDLRKCFDTICHETLLFKLFHYGIRNSEFNWFYSYLNDRKQIVSYNNSKSQCRPINIGIPQGSNLGPLLFILFINDITSHLPNYCYINLYADDTIIYCIHADINVVKQQLQASISQLLHWFKINKLSINSDKTNTMLLSSMKHKFRATKLDMKVDDTVLEQVEEIKYLGLVIDSHLTWKSHISSLCKKISPKLGALARLSHILNKDTLLKIYNGTIQPTLDYCCTVWGHCNTGFIHKLQTYQNRAARIILRNYDWTTRSRDLLNTLNLKGINYRISYFIVCLMFKCLNNLSPYYMSDKFTFLHDICSHHTRYSESYNVLIPKPQVESFKHSFLYQGPSKCNKLPLNIKSAQSLSHLKYLYKYQYKIG